MISSLPTSISRFFSLSSEYELSFSCVLKKSYILLNIKRSDKCILPIFWKVIICMDEFVLFLQISWCDAKHTDLRMVLVNLSSDFPPWFPLWFPQPIRLFCNLFPYPQILLNILQLFLIQVLSRLSYISALGMMTRVTSQVRLLPIQKILLTLMIMTVIINCLCTGCFY